MLHVTIKKKLDVTFNNKQSIRSVVLIFQKVRESYM